MMNDLSTQILFKELDLIDNTISRLDKQIQISKNICITLWTAWLGWFLTDYINGNSKENLNLVILASAIFPILFWLVDFEFRKALLSVGERQSIISLYLNSRDKENTELPLLDPVGWIYNFDVEALVNKCEFKLLDNKKKLLLGQKIHWINILFYKEAKWIFLPLILISIILAICF